jgi:hypothetical protein
MISYYVLTLCTECWNRLIRRTHTDFTLISAPSQIWLKCFRLRSTCITLVGFRFRQLRNEIKYAIISEISLWLSCASVTVVSSYHSWNLLCIYRRPMSIHSVTTTWGVVRLQKKASRCRGQLRIYWKEQCWTVDEVWSSSLVIGRPAKLASCSGFEGHL